MVRNPTDVAWAVFRLSHPWLYAGVLRASTYWPYLEPAKKWDDFRMRFTD